MNEPINEWLFQHLYRIFAVFADRSTQASLTPNQAEFLIDELLRELRRPTTPKVHDLPENVTFSEFLRLLQAIFPDKDDLQVSIDRVFERYINHIIGKGFVLFRRLRKNNRKSCVRFKRQGWKFGWLTIMPGIIKIRKENGKELSIVINNETSIDPPIIDDDRSIFRLISADPNDSIEFSHMDAITAQILIKSFRLARDQTTRESLSDFDYKRSLRLRANTVMRSDKKELEEERNRLEDQLEEERKNRKDEEIVRGLTTRLLKQEMEKSEQMKQVIYELRSKLDHDSGGGDDGKMLSDELELLEPISEPIENEETEIVLPSREEQIQQYAYHFFTSQAEQQVTSDDEEIWKQNYNLIVSTQSV